MKKKKIIIVSFVILAVLLIGAGTVYSLYEHEPGQKEQHEENEEQKDKEKPNKEKVEVNKDAESHKVAEMKSITTPDNKIRFGTTTIYRYNGVSGMTLNVTPYENFDKLYLELTMELSDSNEKVVVYLENLKKQKQVEYEVQSLRDWSTLKTWSVKIITEAEATSLGFEKVND